MQCRRFVGPYRLAVGVIALLRVAPHVISEIVVTAASSEVACGGMCTPGSGGCDSHQWMDVFSTPSGGPWTFEKRVPTTRTLTDYTVPIDGGPKVRAMVAVCRSDGGTDRDDQVVDFIGPRCL